MASMLLSTLCFVFKRQYMLLLFYELELTLSKRYTHTIHVVCLLTNHFVVSIQKQLNSFLSIDLMTIQIEQMMEKSLVVQSSHDRPIHQNKFIYEIWALMRVAVYTWESNNKIRHTTIIIIINSNTRTFSTADDATHL